MDADFFLLNKNGPLFEELVKDENDQTLSQLLAINTQQLVGSLQWRSMKFSQTFKIYRNNETQESLISIENIYSELLKNGDTVKRSNLKRALNSFQGGSRSFLGKESATVLAVLTYLCRHSATHSCNKILKHIEQELVSDQCSFQTSLELYKLIAKTQILRTSLLFNTLTVNESEISTLVVDHKQQFNQLEWKRICWFENDFSKLIKFRDLSFEEIVDLKCSRFQSLLSLSKCCKELCRSSQVQIQKNILRFKSSEKDNEVRIVAGQVHVASVIDNDIKSLLDIYCPDSIEHVVSFDVIHSREKNCFWAVFAQNSGIETDFNDLCLRVFYNLKRRHNVYLEKVALIYSHQLTAFASSNGNIARFCLRDVLETKQFDKVSMTWLAECNIDGTLDALDFDNQCESCFSSTNKKPLTTDNFDIIHEWYLELPIESQILFEHFLNLSTIRKSKTPEKSVRKKLEKLYNVYDILLNIYNKNYIGVFQKLNANKLLIEYKSIGSVFDVTSAVGATSSLNHAEIQLKKQAEVDLCYYNTYLKEHAVEYYSASGTLKTSVNLRSCHLILLLDNLVRLQYIADPNPGEHRSKQLCTLPITLQGLPIDSKITDAWHLPDCDGSFNCICKHPVTLQDGEICKTLLELQQSEKDVQQKFFNLMTFGNRVLWKKLPDDLLELVEESHIEDDNTCQSYVRSPISNQEDETFVEDDGNDDTSEVDNDLVAVLESIRYESDDNIDNHYISDEEEGELSDFTVLEKSMEDMSILDPDFPEETSVFTHLQSFGFEKFKVPPLLCRHPPPATGRDDDIDKIREILDDVLIKAGYEADKTKGANRILCGPDNKIGKCLLQLIKRDQKYRTFLPEFPLLHLRKSKINILFSAYKDAGIVQILKFMKNDEHDDWAKLLSLHHIDTATKHVKRIALSLHLAFFIGFTQYLNDSDLQEFLSDLEIDDCAATSEKWSKRFAEYLNYGTIRNATFSLHVDMMHHCDDIVSIAFAERLGGSTGYNLLLAAAKNSLLFSFVNGAASYAPFCVLLLHSHYTAGHFHQCLKQTLYSTPLKDSSKNFACDTKREMDHLDVVKGFRSGSNIDSVTCRMSLIDSLNETRHKDEPNLNLNEDIDKLGMDLSEVDLNHIYPATSLILRRGGLSLEEVSTPCNVYTKVSLLLPPAILDSASYGVGIYLLERYLQKENIKRPGSTNHEKNVDIQGPKELVGRAKRSKGVTLKRTQAAKVVTAKTERQVKEEKRQKVIVKETKLIDAFHSENNACQALLKPDSSKPKVSKSLGIQRALSGLIKSCTATEPLDQYIAFNLAYVPKSIISSMKICTIEFAGMKFKVGNVKSGQEYLHVVEKMLSKLLKESKVTKIVLCEEKYSFTPDDFKASTREQRKSKSNKDVRHLKTNENILSDDVFDKDALTKTDKGKRLISTYLAENIGKLKLNSDIDVIVDSELIAKKNCICGQSCECLSAYSIPILCTFNADNVDPCITEMTHIGQCKGEAEMSVADWLIQYQSELDTGDSAVCYVTSADIDAVYIHLYAVSRFWKRNNNGSFKNDMYVVLQKAGGKLDIYNITAMLSLFELTYSDQDIGMKIAFTLCLGGNDFIPKLYAISHDTILKHVIDSNNFRNSLYKTVDGKIILNELLFNELVKDLYTPKRYRTSNVSFDDVRAITIAKKEDVNHKGGFRTSNPNKWLPPQSVIERLCGLVQLQIEYMETVGNHASVMPNFAGSKVLNRNSSGEIEYDFGPESHFVSIGDLPEIKQRKGKRLLDDTPQHGARRKRVLTSTPKSKKTFT